MLTNKQRNYLRKLANGIDPIFRIGKGGLTDSMIEQMDLALEARELVKVAVLNNSDEDTREVFDECSARTGAEQVIAVGNRFVLYRQSSEKKKIELPRG